MIEVTDDGPELPDSFVIRDGHGLWNTRTRLEALHGAEEAVLPVALEFHVVPVGQSPEVSHRLGP